jgi:hypothetical protein
MRSGHYRQYAQECLRLANDLSDPGCRTALLDMAMAWMRLSEQAASLNNRPYAHLAAASDNENSLRGDALLPENQGRPRG